MLLLDDVLVIVVSEPFGWSTTLCHFIFAIQVNQIRENVAWSFPVALSVLNSARSQDVVTFCFSASIVL